MSRLTEKKNNKYVYDDIYCGKHIDKLGQLEDIEEELGINLVTFLKATTNGIYKIQYKSLYLEHDFKPSILKYNKEEKCFEAIIKDMGASWTEKYYLKDYGKTWVVTKEELL